MVQHTQGQRAAAHAASWGPPHPAAQLNSHLLSARWMGRLAAPARRRASTRPCLLLAVLAPRMCEVYLPSGKSPPRHTNRLTCNAEA